MKMWMIILMFITVGLWAESTVEIGWVPNMGVTDFTEHYQNILDNTLFYVKMSSTVDIYKYLHIGGSIKTYIFMKDNMINFVPFYIDYYFETYTTIIDNVEVGFRHWCSHPQNTREGYQDSIMTMNRHYEEVYIQYKF